LDFVRAGHASRVLAIGTDAFSRTALAGFGRLGALAKDSCRPFSADRDGLILGEGAAAVLIESESSMRRRDVAALAEIGGWGLACDAFHITSPHPSGDGLARAMIGALADAGVAARDVDWVCAHGTATQANDRAEVAAMTAVFGGNSVVPASSIKALTGHSLGAASAIEAVACVLALRDQVAPPTWNFRTPDPECDWDIIANEPRPGRYDVVLNNAAAFGGNNAAIVLRKVETSP
jgi:3-oxoacyl-[acyl-carrier-protein] synthase II